MDKTKFEEFRKHVPVACKKAYFETAGTGLIPDFIFEAVSHYHRERYLVGGDSTWPYDDGSCLSTLEMMDRSKATIAEMIRAKKEDIAFGQNSSHMYTLFSSGLKFQSGDNIVLPKHGWIGNRFAWQIRQKDGLELRYVEPQNGVLKPEDFMKMCDERTRAVTVNLVESNTGFLMDVEPLGRFCRKKGIWFAVDAVQALGVLPVDVENMCIDFLVGNDYKWMMNFCGTGYAYIHPKLREALNQTEAGWMSDEQRFDTKKENLDLRKDSGRFELGYPTASGIYGLGLAAEKYNSMGRDEIAAYVLELADELRSKVEKIHGVRLQYCFPKENCTSIVALLLDQDLEITNESLKEAGIHAHVNPSPKENCQLMRVSLHYYNNREDVERLCQALAGKRG